MLRRIATIVGYFLVFCLVVTLTIGLVAYGSGYSYSFSKHKIVRTGIVIIQSSPSNLAVSEDGKKAIHKTTYHESFEAGSYVFKIADSGFRTWQKTLSVLAGDVTFVQYVVMIPTNINSQTITTTPVVASETVSRDHRHLAYITSGTDPAVYGYDFGSQTLGKIYTPVAATATVPVETLQSVQWSGDGSHLLVFTTVNGATVVRLMSATGGDVTNLTSQYSFDFTGLTFSSNDWHQMYWVSNDAGLRRLDVGSQSVSAILASPVKQFEVSADRLLYVQLNDAVDSLWSLDSRNHKQELVSALAPSDKYSFAYLNYSGIDVLGVVPVSTGVGTLYTNILGYTPIAQTLAHGATDVSFSPDGHLIAFSGPTSITTYDLDQSNVFNKSIDYTFAVSNLSQAPTWFDNYHLLTSQNGRLVWTEFDGQNSADLGAVSSILPSFSSSDFKSVLEFRQVNDQTQLLNLKIKP